MGRPIVPVGLSPGLHRVTFPDSGQNGTKGGGEKKVISQKAMAPGDVKIQKDEKNNYSRMASSVCGVPC